MTMSGGKKESNKLPVPPRNFWNTSYFAPLDGLRALSLLLVVAGHVRTELPMRSYFSGGLGVGIFFVLSGFLITILLLREELDRGGVSLGGFYIRRAFRIFPPYLLALGTYLLIALVPSQHELKAKIFRGLPYFLSLRNEYVPPGVQVAFTHSWSLSVEEKFYFLWPLLFFVFLRRGKLRWALVPITLAPLFLSVSESLPVAYFSLLLGCCVAVALNALRAQQKRTLLWVKRLPVPLVLAAWCLSYLASLHGAYRVSFVLCTAALLPVLLLKESVLSRVLGSRCCVWVGKRTYSMYLFHALCLTFIEQRIIHPTTGAGFAFVVLLAYVASLGVSAIVYVLLEKPAIAWGRTLAAAYTRSREQRDRSSFEPTTGQKPEYTAALHP